ncbi:hypothetical protein E4U21_002677 [Claviceps maximensis]|nr:hypothetical protein E4U21_002677 [Claviceps maximensis]
MSFSLTSRDFWLEDSHILHAWCLDMNDAYRESSLDLNKCLGNKDGFFQWGGENFADTASDVEMSATILSAKMLTEDDIVGERQRVDLNEHIANTDGQLTVTADECSAVCLSSHKTSRRDNKQQRLIWLINSRLVRRRDSHEDNKRDFQTEKSALPVT